MLLGADVARRAVSYLSGREDRGRRGVPRAHRARDRGARARRARPRQPHDRAARSCVTGKTVRNYVYGIAAKLGAADRGRLIVMAREAGLGTDAAESQDIRPARSRASAPLGRDFGFSRIVNGQSTVPTSIPTGASPCPAPPCGEPFRPPPCSESSASPAAVSHRPPRRPRLEPTGRRGRLRPRAVRHDPARGAGHLRRSAVRRIRGRQPRFRLHHHARWPGAITNNHVVTGAAPSTCGAAATPRRPCAREGARRLGVPRPRGRAARGGRLPVLRLVRGRHHDRDGRLRGRATRSVT